MTNEISKELAKQIFIEYSPYVYQTALLLTKSESLADDVTQETFIQVFKKYHTFDTNRPMKPWIYKITVNTIRNMIRKQRWLKFIGFSPEISDEKNSIEHFILQDERNNGLWSEINQMPAKSKEIIVLHYYAELKISEIAEILNIPIGTCKSRLNTALSQLRRKLPKNELFNVHKGGEIYGEN